MCPCHWPLGGARGGRAPEVGHHLGSWRMCARAQFGLDPLGRSKVDGGWASKKAGWFVARRPSPFERAAGGGLGYEAKQSERRGGPLGNRRWAEAGRAYARANRRLPLRRGRLQDAGGDVGGRGRAPSPVYRALAPAPARSLQRAPRRGVAEPRRRAEKIDIYGEVG